MVNITVDGKSYNTVLQEAQYHKINDKLIHADFLEVVDGKEVIVQIPVKTKGMAEGVKDGGRLVMTLRKLKVKGLINKLPERIELNIEKLTIGKSISIGEIKLEGVTILHPKNISVVSVQMTREVVEEVAPTVATTAVATTATATPGVTSATPAATTDAKTPPAKK